MKAVVFLFLGMFIGFIASQNPTSYPYPSADYVLNYDLDGVVKIQLVPNSSLKDGDCWTGNCTNNVVTNIYLNDLVPGDICSLAENLSNRTDIPVSLFNISGSSLVLSVTTLFNVLFNSGTDCIFDLECLINATADALAAYNISSLEEIDINIIESEVPLIDLNNTACTPSYCTSYPKTVINYIIPSFCNSSCIQPKPLTCFPIPTYFTEYLLYRYELLRANLNLQNLLTQINQEHDTILACLVDPTTCPPGWNLSALIAAQTTFGQTCLADWENTLLYDYITPI